MTYKLDHDDLFSPHEISPTAIQAKVPPTGADDVFAIRHLSRRAAHAKRILYMQMRLGERALQSRAVLLDSEPSWFERRREGYVALRARRYLERVKLASV
jgi:hypothetical protein